MTPRSLRGDPLLTSHNGGFISVNSAELQARLGALISSQAYRSEDPDGSQHSPDDVSIVESWWSASENDFLSRGTEVDQGSTKFEISLVPTNVGEIDASISLTATWVTSIANDGDLWHQTIRVGGESRNTICLDVPFKLTHEDDDTMTYTPTSDFVLSLSSKQDSTSGISSTSGHSRNASADSNNPAASPGAGSDMIERCTWEISAWLSDCVLAAEKRNKSFQLLEMYVDRGFESQEQMPDGQLVSVWSKADGSLCQSQLIFGFSDKRMVLQDT